MAETYNSPIAASYHGPMVLVVGRLQSEHGLVKIVIVRNLTQVVGPSLICNTDHIEPRFKRGLERLPSIYSSEKNRRAGFNLVSATLLTAGWRWI